MNYSAVVASTSAGASSVIGHSPSVQVVPSSQTPLVQVFSQVSSVAGTTVSSTEVVVSSDIIKRIGNRTEIIAGSPVFQEFMFDNYIINCLINKKRRVSPALFIG
jgi:hypothetical protein